MHSDTRLYDELTRVMLQINKQIESVTKFAEKRIAGMPYPDKVTVYDIRDTHGKPILSDLLCAKADCLNGMAAIKASQKKGK